MQSEWLHARVREKLRLLHAAVLDLEHLQAEIEAQGVVCPTPRVARSVNPWAAGVHKFIAELPAECTRFRMRELVAALGLQTDPPPREILQRIGQAIAIEGWKRREGTRPRGDKRKSHFYERPS